MSNDNFAFRGPPPPSSSSPPAKFGDYRIGHVVLFDRPLSDEPRPVWRPWYRRFTDWLLRRPVRMVSEREQAREAVMAMRGDDGE